MKLLVIGHARHGKDTVCEILRDEYGLTFKSSSEFCAEKVVFPRMPRYTTWQKCFADRANHRGEWFNVIAEYNAGDPGRLGREIFAEYDIYCGLRNVEEFRALKADHVIWVDASKRQPLESTASMTLTEEMADLWIDNNGDLDNLRSEIQRVCGIMGLRR
jgi:dephospho-CoA kinase